MLALGGRGAGGGGVWSRVQTEMTNSLLESGTLKKWIVDCTKGTGPGGYGRSVGPGWKGIKKLMENWDSVLHAATTPKWGVFQSELH